MKCSVPKLATPPKIDGNWNKPPWQNIASQKIDKYMGAKPQHLPRTEVKLAYDDNAIYVIFRVEDRYIRAVAQKHQDCVCTDSCVEFFFCPGTDIEKGYFNLEMNCGGIMLFHYQLVPRKDQVKVSEADCAKVQIAHSQPQIVNPEVAGPVTWTVEYRLPFDLLGNYRSVVKPAPGVTWRANFFKCADHTSHPHWLTWAFVDRPRPDFHVPEAFTALEFE